MWLVHSLFALVLLSLFLSMFSSAPKSHASAAAKSEDGPTDIQSNASFPPIKA